MPTLLEELTKRDFLQDVTPGLAERLQQGSITGYVGFDPTADSLHVGNLVPVMALAWLQRCGGRPIVLVGGGTGMVGDPSGKRTERPVLSLAQIDHNVACQKAQLTRFLRFDGPGAATVCNNADWLRPLGLMEFLRDAGKHFTVNYMLAKDSVKNRMETGISYTEFTYMLIQAYDFWHLWKTERCELQMGGSDQWGNITAGTELISRKEGAPAHGLTLPLLTTASGAKFGKSEQGAIYLDPKKTSPYKFFQFWLNSEDADVARWLRFFTFFPVEEIEALMAEQARDPGKRVAQRRLAEEMTTRIHGEATCRGVVEASRLLFGGADWRAVGGDLLQVLAGEIPAVTLPAAELAGLGVADALVKVGLASSRGDARRGLQGKGFSLNGAALEAADRALSADDLLAGRYVVLQKGKRNYALLVLEG
ncbi:MAG: tyrosine--tRNA ligase [Anaeromyxobacter sp.]|nr:tyrosine--tRNA ligase [Anaeromyxobacter sp.]MBL0277250.1 tyrosine--tRNA ligase [Anaeromyxobacter sp.]